MSLVSCELPVGVALHQWKRGKNFRDLIAAPEGYALVEFDFAGQEYRWMAVASGDPTMLHLCEPGEDGHAYMGAEIAHLDYKWLQEAAKVDDSPEEKIRKGGKVGNLSCQYRTSAKRLYVTARVDYGMDLSMDEAQHIHATYRRVYSGVPRYWDSSVAKAKTREYAETFAGRRVIIRGNWTRDSWALSSTAINYPIQGTGGDQKYLALAIVEPYLAKAGGYFYYELHDGLFFLLPKNNKLKTHLVNMEKMLSNLPYKKAWQFTSPIQFPVDGKIGDRWGSMISMGKFLEN